jgi:hypothetical protein
MLTEEQKKLKSEIITQSLESLKDLMSKLDANNINIVSELKYTITVLNDLK